MRHEFKELGITAWASHLTGWVTVQGEGVEYGWPISSPEVPAFVRKALGLKGVAYGV